MSLRFRYQWSCKGTVCCRSCPWLLTVYSAYALKVWHLSSQNKSLVGPLFLLILVAFGIGVFTGFPLQPGDTEIVNWSYAEPFTIMRLPQLGLTTAGDILITWSLVHYLRAGHSRQYFARTRSLVHRLILYCVATGLATSVLSTASFIMLAVNAIRGESVRSFNPDHGLVISRLVVEALFLYTLCGSVYINAYLASLNLRNNLRNIGRPHEGRFISAISREMEETQVDKVLVIGPGVTLDARSRV
ncbi:hypothetical protein HGRIS_004113 [Hohenbuehelia grisea]|uniref:DUF6534 domain-containing protein n=1 Tax=Hohenbuehelia grisea TaxID=104357 RepID=A0ABR3JJ88_9AGAR